MWEVESLPPGAGTITGNVPEMRASRDPMQPKPFRKFSGSFLERATSQLGEDLRNPLNLLNAIPGVSYHRSSSPGYDYDPAETAGHAGYGAGVALVTHAADLAPGPRVGPEVPPRIPAWKTAPSEGTSIPSIIDRQPYAQAARSRTAPAPSTAAPRTPLWKAMNTEGEEVPSIVNRQPYAQPARARTAPQASTGAPRLIEQMGGKPVETITQHSAYPPEAPSPVIQRGPIPGSAEDIAETKDIQGQVRDAADAEDRARLLALTRERFPGRTKFDLTGQAVKYTKTPGVKLADKVRQVPGPNEDLTSLLKKSVKWAKQKGD